MLKQKIFDLLKSPDFEKELDSIAEVPMHKVISPLFTALCSEDEEIKWHAVSVMGILVAKSAETDLEGARDILRRMLWSLNEESGSIGWGMPEAMGEILVRTEKLAQEFAPILVSYIRPDGNLLEFELLQRGVLWGIGRLAEIQPQLMQSLRADRYLLPYLGSRDSSVRGLAAWVLGSIGGEESIPRLASLLQDEAEIKLYKDRKLKTARVHELANEALALIKRRGWA